MIRNSHGKYWQVTHVYYKYTIYTVNMNIWPNFNPSPCTRIFYETGFAREYKCIPRDDYR